MNDSRPTDKPKILIVDDTPTNLSILEEILDEDYFISIAQSGTQALSITDKFVPDLILLDVNMPGIDGFETCRRLKSRKETCDIPVVFITARAEPEDVIQGFKEGGVDYITKPFNHNEVMVRVKTHLKVQQLIRQLEFKNDQLKEVNDLKNKFLGMASHDMRNYLSAIKGYSQILQEDKEELPAETKDQFLSFIFKSSENMLKMVNDLLDVSVIESGRLQLDLHPESFKNLIEHHNMIIRFFADKKNILLQYDLDDVPDCQMDANKIGQVIDNLISNAIKFSKSGTTVFISLKERGGKLVFSVKDEGPGISEEDQAKLFQHFQKLSARPTAGESSSGLGLAISKKMVQAHDGCLNVTSQLGSGATFSFEIPLK
ncbi:MAG: hybrid sensor histidine kinase/response regulator [Nitrospinota bacterium]|nr:hybrid sensor histidine kinase/response regulator [Nitrospinota bacterium]